MKTSFRLVLVMVLIGLVLSKSVRDDMEKEDGQRVARSADSDSSSDTESNESDSDSSDSSESTESDERR